MSINIQITGSPLSSPHSNVIYETEQTDIIISENDTDSRTPTIASSPLLSIPKRLLKLDIFARCSFQPQESHQSSENEHELSQPIVVGRTPSKVDLLFFNQVITFTKAFPEGVKHLVRATYVMHSPPSFSSLSFVQKIASRTLFPYEFLESSLREMIVTHIRDYVGDTPFILVEEKPFAVIKVKDECRGGMNERSHKGDGFYGNRVVQQISKEGIPSYLEIPNENIAAGLMSPSILSMEISLTHSGFHFRTNPVFSTSKRVLVQAFIPKAKSLLQLSNKERENVLNKIPLRNLQKMAILDISLCNTDRNPNNFLFSEGTLFPIDHSNILPSKFSSNAVFAWMVFPEAHYIFDKESLKQIESMDFEKDREKIKAAYPNYPEENLHTMKICYYLLKTGAAFNLTPFEIGSFLVGGINRSEAFALIAVWYNDISKNTDDPEEIFRTIKGFIDDSIAYISKHSTQIESEILDMEGDFYSNLHAQYFNIFRKCWQINQ